MFAAQSFRRRRVKNCSLLFFIFLCLYVRDENRPRHFFAVLFTVNARGSQDL